MTHAHYVLKRAGVIEEGRGALMAWYINTVGHALDALPSEMRDALHDLHRQGLMRQEWDDHPTNDGMPREVWHITALGRRALCVPGWQPGQEVPPLAALSVEELRARFRADPPLPR